MTLLTEMKTLARSIPLGRRDEWIRYFMSIAYMVSLRSTCGSRRVGAVMVDGIETGKRRIIATGYNGYPPGAAHCSEGGCPRFEAKKKGMLKSGEYPDEFRCDAFHAEANALFQVMKSPISAKGGVMFTTTFPCLQCARKMNGAQIRTIYYAEGYPDESSRAYLHRYGMRAIRIAPAGIMERIVDLCTRTPLGMRDEWETYFMSLAYMVSLRSKSSRERNGAVLVSNMETKRIIATGYNGFPVADHPDQEEEQAHLEDLFTGGENALNQLKVSSMTSEGSVLFSTLVPSFDLMVELNGAGIRTVCYHEGDPTDAVMSYTARYGMTLTKIG